MRGVRGSEGERETGTKKMPGGKGNAGTREMREGSERGRGVKIAFGVLSGAAAWLARRR